MGDKVAHKQSNSTGDSTNIKTQLSMPERRPLTLAMIVNVRA